MTGIGHNRPPTPFDEVSEALATLHVEASNWLDGTPIENQQQADAVAELITQIRAAKKAADEARRAEAKPFDDGKAKVQARYKPLLTSADTMADGCKALLAPYLERVEAEKRAKAEAERKAADEARAKAEEAIRAAAATDLAAKEAAEMALTEAKKAEAAAKRAEADKAAGKGSGRAVGLRTVYEPEIMDMVAVARHFWEHDRAAVDAFFADLVAKAVRAGARDLPGVIVRERRVAQ